MKPMNLVKAMLAGAAAAVLAGAAAAQTPAPTPAQAAPATVPQAEVSDVATVPPPSQRWVYASGGFGLAGVRIFDGDTGKMKATIQVPSLGNLGLDPTGRYYYVAETMWSRITRGARQDMVSIYDATTLKLVAEVPIPNRLLGGTSTQNFVISNNGKLGFVYNMLPSSSVEVVDLEKHKLRQTVDLPGCAALFPSGPDGVAALCADGSMAMVSFAGSKASVTHTAPFFPATTDPVFDNVVFDRVKNQATFISYTGKVYQATLAAAPKIEAPWSLQAAAGVREAVAAPNDVNWVPGGRQPFAVNTVTGRIYVLMHVGEQWSHKEPGDEIWVVDAASRKVIARRPTPAKVGNIQVSQAATAPLVYVAGQDGHVYILDGQTLETKHDLTRAGGGAMFVNQPS